MSEYDPIEHNLVVNEVTDIGGVQRSLVRHMHNTAILDTVQRYPELCIEGDTGFHCLNTPLLTCAALVAERDYKGYKRTKHHSPSPIVHVQNPLVFFPLTNDRRYADSVLYKVGFNSTYGIAHFDRLGLFVVLPYDLEKTTFEAHRILNSNYVWDSGDTNYIDHVIDTYFYYNSRLQRFLRERLHPEFANGEMTHQVLLRLMNQYLDQRGFDQIPDTDITYTF
ncbi:hypothetical protein KC909_04700 [Candidatus Dojkabacteria bacterium]|uniref:Uncharacterized protein n=1 Tax=Candidatus Dojkabacteria bacterium TaxID=2099670 RepID=A0A955L6J3_9BACT|nr:hypothetical protein [Candidatus Dojkabacteria bacterium]